jgi:mRNA interferase MazF
MKFFEQWIKVKASLDSLIVAPPHTSERDVWWVTLGENVGKEISGKSTVFKRPALIYKKLSRDFYLVIPSTTKVHTGNWFTKITFQNIDMYFCLHQIRSIDHRRLDKRMGQLTQNHFEQIVKDFNALYIKDESPHLIKDTGDAANAEKVALG